MSYKRKEEVIDTNTNFVLALGITGNSNFIKDEIVYIKYDAVSQGTAQVLYSNSTYLTVQHIFDDAFPPAILKK